jgi:hemolysin activation/secretion protein
MPFLLARPDSRLAAAMLILALTLAPDDRTLFAAEQGDPAAKEPAPEFALSEIRVLGNTALAATDVERAVYPFLGERRTIKDVEAARDALAAVYQSKGFGAVYVEIPEQEVNDGLVRLRVTEGRVDRVKIMGTRYFSNGRIRTLLPAVVSGEVLNVTRLQEQMAVANRESRDRTVVPVLRAGRSPGTVDVDLKVADKLPLHASVDVNNRYTVNTSQTRLGVTLSYDNLFQRFHSLSFQYQTAPADPSQTRVLAATYLMPLSGTTNLALYAVDTNSDVAAVGALSVIGAGRIYGARLIETLEPLSPRYQHNFTFGMDFKDFKDSIQLVGGADVTPIKYVSWTGAYAANVTTDSTASAFNVAGTFGVRRLVNSSDDFQYKRYRARPNFIYLRASAQHERPLLLGTRLFVRASTQLTTAPLISNEQMSAGGAESVRGYPESDALGDTGLLSSMEWRSPQLAPLMGKHWTTAYFFTFFEGGYVRILNPLPRQTNRFDLASWGAGIRLAGFGGASASLDWAVPRSRTTNTAVGDSRLHFDVSYAF